MATVISKNNHEMHDELTGSDPIRNAADVDRLSAQLMRLFGLNHRRLARLLDRYNLTIPQYYTLSALFNQGPTCRMGDLAHHLHQSSPTMTGIVTRLEADALVERVMDPEDRRAVRVRVTERARKMLEEVRAAESASMARTLDRISADDRRSLLRSLDVYLDALTEGAETGS